MAELVLDNLGRRYGAVTAIAEVALTVARGEFVTLLGPSGCGKSTTLAAIAGLDQPTEGRVRHDGRVLSDAATGQFVPPEGRGFGVVFQSYALWPHRTVAENVALPLTLRRVGRAERDARVAETLALVGLADQAARYPAELSGGQQQRVALARAIVYRPRVLLLDEPLSNLDVQLRRAARGWLSSLTRDLGLTVVHVTHDQEEALAMSDRVVVMEAGRIRQIGTPQEIYADPADPFTASFIGAANLIRGARLAACGRRATLLGGLSVEVTPVGAPRPGAAVDLVVRPHCLRPAPEGLPVTFGAAACLGDHWEQELTLAGEALRLKTDHPIPPGPGHVTIRAEDLRAYLAQARG